MFYSLGEDTPKAGIASSKNIDYGFTRSLKKPQRFLTKERPFMKLDNFLKPTMILTLLLTGFLNNSWAQVVNSGANSASSNSQITMSATVPKVIVVQVNSGTSILSKAISANTIDASSNTVAQDFQIRGTVTVNDATANVQCTLNTTALNLSNSGSNIKVNLSGTIGGTNISTSAFTPVFSSKQASININGDIDDTTVTSSLNPGSYTGTLTITATLI